jgi:hypothetical protein
MNKVIDDHDGFLRGLERIKYAGLLASQEEIAEQTVLEEILEELPEEIKSDAPVVDGKAQIGDEQNPTEFIETNNNSLKNDTRKKPNQRK